MKAFSLRLCGCLMGVFTLAAMEGFITAPTWGAAVLLAAYGALTLHLCKAADSVQAHRKGQKGGEGQNSIHEKSP